MSAWKIFFNCSKSHYYISFQVPDFFNKATELLDDMEWENRKSYCYLNMNIAKNKMAFSRAAFTLVVLLNTLIIFSYPFSNSKVDFNEKANVCALAFLGSLPIFLHSKFEYRWSIVMFMLSLIFSSTVDGLVRMLGTASVITKCFHIFGLLYEIQVKQPSRRSFFSNTDLQFQMVYAIVAGVATVFNPLIFSVLVWEF